MKTKLTGIIITPKDPRYPAARREFNLRFNKFPALIVFCQNTTDVINAIKWARENKVPFRIRSGRHSYEGFSALNGGMIIDVSHMNKIYVNKRENWALVESGVRLGELYKTLSAQGVIVPAGTDPSVGTGGLTLGGGIGMLSRKMGLTIDNLIGLEIAVASGTKGAKLIDVNKKSHSDLLWASRGGGGGNFGVVTKFIYKLNPISTVTIYEATWRFAQIEKVLDNWQRWAPFTDRRLTSSINLNSAKKKTISSVGQFLGSPEELRKLLKPLLRGTTPLKLDIRQETFMDAVEFFRGTDQYDIRKTKSTGDFVYKLLPAQAISTIKRFLENTPNKHTLVWSQGLAGAISDVKPHETAYVHRNAIFPLEFVTKWHSDSEEPANIAWAEKIRKAMIPYTKGDYVNWVDLFIKDYPTSYYGSNYARLKKIKQTYDPYNVFRFPQSIKST